MSVFYKLAQPDGWDWYTGDTINYREAVGGTVEVPQRDYAIEPLLCHRSVLHACREPNQCFIGAKLPCSVYEVHGSPVVDDGEKQGFKNLRVLREVPAEELDELFGWRIVEAMDPVNPFEIEPPEITEKHITLQSGPRSGPRSGPQSGPRSGPILEASSQASNDGSMLNRAKTRIPISPSSISGDRDSYPATTGNIGGSTADQTQKYSTRYRERRLRPDEQS